MARLHALAASTSVRLLAARFPRTWVVQKHQTLSSIAKAVYGRADAWTLIYYANKHKIADPMVITEGLVLKLVRLRGNPPPPPAPPPAPVSVPAPAAGSPAVPAATYDGGSGFQQCVISRESGGNSQVMNASGHYGLYQFSAGTWATYGGNPADFGHASVAEQNQVFANAMAAGGADNWAPYDGC
jgi:hypothetical protein